MATSKSHSMKVLSQTKGWSKGIALLKLLNVLEEEWKGRENQEKPPNATEGEISYPDFPHA